MVTRTIAALAAALLLTSTAFAGTTRYNPRRSGHPLRIVAYMLHPVGVVADTLFFHPAWWLGTHEPLRTLFGVEVMVDDSADVARAMEERRAKEAPAPVEPPAPSEPDRAEPETPPGD
jgi:hypothetical protein